MQNDLPVVSGRARTPAHRTAEANQSLVHFVITRHFRPLLSDPERHAEAFTAGYMELIHAAERFDPSRGRAFSSYACRCIQGGILRFFRNERVQNALKPESLELPIGEEGWTLADVIADTAPPVGADLLDRAGFDRLLSGLRSDRDRALIRAVYVDGESVEAAGMRVGMGRGLAKQAHQKALKDLRVSLRLRKTPTSGVEWARLCSDASERLAS